MSEWIDVPITKVAVGDEVKVDGIGFTSKSGEAMAVEYAGYWWSPVYEIQTDRVLRQQSLGVVPSLLHRLSPPPQARAEPEPYQPVIFVDRDPSILADKIRTFQP